MKHILVPTDFSEAANNALEYALQLAAETSASVTFLNVYHVPLPAGEVPLLLISPHEILEKNHDHMKGLVATAKSTYGGNISISGITREGFAAEEIVQVTEEIGADMVVMGTRGSTSTIASILGSIATEVMKKSKVPVLVIPSHARYRHIKEIAYAFDYTKEPDVRTETFLKEVAGVFKAKIDVVNVITPKSTTQLKVVASAVGTDKILSDTYHEHYFLQGSDTVHELSNFVREHDADWLVVVPHEYGFLHAFFHRSVATQVAMQIEIPVLSIHE